MLDAGGGGGASSASGGSPGSGGGMQGATGGTAAGGGGGTANGGSGVGGAAGEPWFDDPKGPQACLTRGCPTGQVCAVAMWNGATNVDRCLPWPDSCTDCTCALAALAAYYKARFAPPQGLPPTCNCRDASNQVIDGGAAQVATAICMGA